MAQIPVSNAGVNRTLFAAHTVYSRPVTASDSEARHRQQMLSEGNQKKTAPMILSRQVCFKLAPGPGHFELLPTNSIQAKDSLKFPIVLKYSNLKHSKNIT